MGTVNAPGAHGSDESNRDAYGKDVSMLSGFHRSCSRACLSLSGVQAEGETLLTYALQPTQRCAYIYLITSPDPSPSACVTTHYTGTAHIRILEKHNGVHRS